MYLETQCHHPWFFNVDCGTTIKGRFITRGISSLGMREICAILKLAVVVLLSTVIGCAIPKDHSTTRSKKGIEGMWQGNLINSEELTNKIELFVFENGEHLQGSYS